MLKFEWAEPSAPTICECCGGKSFRLTRFISNYGNAFAVVYAAFSDKHENRLVKLAVSLGEWWLDSSPLRRCFIVWYINSPENYGFLIRDPIDGIWPEATLLGQQLSREIALNDPYIKDVWHILDHIALEDPILHPYMQDGVMPNLSSFGHK